MIMMIMIVVMMMIVPTCDAYKISISTMSMNSMNGINSIIHRCQRCSAAVLTSSAVMISSISSISILSNPSQVVAIESSSSSSSSSSIPSVPVYNKRSSDLQSYSDITKGFKLLRPFGFNEFDGAGGGYAVKFASLFDVDENVVIGSAPATAGKTSIVDYGDVDELGKKLATKRGGTLKSASARQTDGIVFYQFEFENPLDPSLPRTGPKNNRPTVSIELYELCVNRGRLWSVQATSNDKLFKDHEQTFRHVLASFLPKL